MDENFKKEQLTSCVFCDKTITGKSFYKSKKFSALYNIAPILPGHTLIIPNSHHESLMDLSEDELSGIMIFARKITLVLKTVFDSDGFDWTIQDGSSAGQTVPHLHLHIIPRKLHDLPEGDDWYGKIHHSEVQLIDSRNRIRLNDSEYKEITMKLRKVATAMHKSGQI